MREAEDSASGFTGQGQVVAAAHGTLSPLLDVQEHAHSIHTMGNQGCML